MGIKITDNVSRLLMNAQRKLPITVEQAVSRITQAGVIDIIARTKNGVDANGKPFRDYSEWYREYRKSKGKSASVNLEFTGAMLRAIQARTEKQGDKIVGIINMNDSTEREKALKHINGDKETHLPKRDFWGLSKSFKEKFKKVLGESINFNRIVK